MKNPFARVSILATAFAVMALGFLMPSSTIAAINASVINADHEPGGLDAVFGIKPEAYFDPMELLTANDNNGAEPVSLHLSQRDFDFPAVPEPERDEINLRDQAMGQAMSALSLTPGDHGIGIGVSIGTFEGEKAVAAGVSYTPAKVFTIKGATAISAAGEIGAGVSVGFSF